MQAYALKTTHGSISTRTDDDSGIPEDDFSIAGSFQSQTEEPDVRQLATFSIDLLLELYLTSVGSYYYSIKTL